MLHWGNRTLQLHCMTNFNCAILHEDVNWSLGNFMEYAWSGSWFTSVFWENFATKMVQGKWGWHVWNGNKTFLKSKQWAQFPVRFAWHILKPVSQEKCRRKREGNCALYGGPWTLALLMPRAEETSAISFADATSCHWQRGLQHCWHHWQRDNSEQFTV